MPLNLTTEQWAEFSAIREKWYRDIKPFNGLAYSSVFEPVPTFHPDHLKDARILPRREDVFQFLSKGGRVAEVGTQEGVFARKIYDSLAPSELHLFDLDFTPFHERGEFEPDTAGLVLHVGDSSTELSSFPNEYFDVIYIDADHSYEGCKRDSGVAVSKLKPDGLLWFNDFCIWSPLEMIDYGVPHVVSELCQTGDWKVSFVALHPLFYNDVALSRRG
jgi:hypothetical protein